MQNIGQNKRHWCNNNVKMKNNKFVKDHFKNCTCYNFNDISKLEDFDLWHLDALLEFMMELGV